MRQNSTRTPPKHANPSPHHNSNNINDQKAKNKSGKINRIVHKKEKEKEYEKTKGKKSDYEQRKGRELIIVVHRKRKMGKRNTEKVTKITKG